MKNKYQTLPELTREQILSSMKLPFEYLKSRAREEKIAWELNIDYLVDNFQQGCRDFFGLNLNEYCFPIFDLEEPTPGFLNNFIYWFSLISNSKEISKKKNISKEEILDQVVNMESKYASLVWYGRSDFENESLNNSRNKIKNAFPSEVKLLETSDSNWDHGYFTGIMVALRYIMDLEDLGIKKANNNFPVLDI